MPTRSNLMSLVCLMILSACGPQTIVSSAMDPSPQPTSPVAPVAQPSAATVPVVAACAQPLDQQAFALRLKSFAPTVLQPGMKWVYSIEGGLGFSSEVLSVQAGKVRLRTSILIAGSGQSQEKEVDAANFEPYSSSGQNNLGQGSGFSFCEQGTESVTVPAGSFTASRFSFKASAGGNESQGNIWLSQGVGTVKLESEVSIPGGSKIKATTVLKEKQ